METRITRDDIDSRDNALGRKVISIYNVGTNKHNQPNNLPSFALILYLNFNIKSINGISSYGAPLAQRASYFALYSSLFGPDGTVNYDYIVTNSIKSWYWLNVHVFPMVHMVHTYKPLLTQFGSYMYF